MPFNVHFLFSHSYPAPLAAACGVKPTLSGAAAVARFELGPPSALVLAGDLDETYDSKAHFLPSYRDIFCYILVPGFSDSLLNGGIFLSLTPVNVS